MLELFKGMSDRHTAICRFPMDTTIIIPKNCSLEVLAAQLQPYTDKFLYVVDDVMLNYYTSLDEVPPGPRRLEQAAPLGYGQSNFYIRDLAQKHLICCFDQNLCRQLLGSGFDADPTLKKSESNPDLTGRDSGRIPLESRSIRIITTQRPDHVSSEPKGVSSSRHSRSKDSSPNKVVAKKSTRSEKDNQRGKVIDLSTPVDVAPSVKVTKRI
jgi:hypothetical protein